MELLKECDMNNNILDEQLKFNDSTNNIIIMLLKKIDELEYKVLQLQLDIVDLNSQTPNERFVKDIFAIEKSVEYGEQ